MLNWSTNFGNEFIYWMLMILLLSVLIWCGYGISKGKTNKFWTYGWIAIFSYTLIEGLRYLRGADYVHYMNDLDGRLFRDNYELGYLAFIHLFHAVGLNSVFGFLFYSFITIHPVILITKKLPKLANWLLPSFFLITQMASENIIRQYIAISFLLYAIYFYIDKKKLWMYIMFLLVPFFHLSGLFAVAIFVIILNFNTGKFAKKPWILLLIYYFVYFIWNIDWFSGITQHLAILKFDNDNMQSYIDNADTWFTADALNGKDVHTRSIIITISEFVFFSIFIWLGPSIVKKGKAAALFFWCSYVSIIIYTLAGGIEIYLRLYSWLNYIIPFGLSYVIAYSNTRKRELSIFKICSFFYLLLCGSMYLLLIWHRPYAGCGFIWDK